MYSEAGPSGRAAFGLEESIGAFYIGVDVMAQPWAEWFYSSKTWTDCRLAFLKSKFFICQRCGGAATIAHHKTYLTPANINNPDITLNWENLEALCQDCHNKEHISKGATREDVMFDENGDLIPASNTPPYLKTGGCSWRPSGLPPKTPERART